MLAAALALWLSHFGTNRPIVVLAAICEVNFYRHVVCPVLECLLVTLAVSTGAANVSTQRVVVSVVATVHVHVARSRLLLHVAFVVTIQMAVIPLLLGCHLPVRLLTGVTETRGVEVNPGFGLQDPLFLVLTDFKVQMGLRLLLRLDGRLFESELGVVHLARLAAVRLLHRSSHLILVAYCERLLGKACGWPLRIVLVLGAELPSNRIRSDSSRCYALGLLVALAFECWLFSNPYVALWLCLHKLRRSLLLRSLTFLLLARYEEH